MWKTSRISLGAFDSKGKLEKNQSYFLHLMIAGYMTRYENKTKQSLKMSTSLCLYYIILQTESAHHLVSKWSRPANTNLSNHETYKMASDYHYINTELRIFKINHDCIWPQLYAYTPSLLWSNAKHGILDSYLHTEQEKSLSSSLKPTLICHCYRENTHTEKCQKTTLIIFQNQKIFQTV